MTLPKCQLPRTPDEPGPVPSSREQKVIVRRHPTESPSDLIVYLRDVSGSSINSFAISFLQALLDIGYLWWNPGQCLFTTFSSISFICMVAFSSGSFRICSFGLIPHRWMFTGFMSTIFTRFSSVSSFSSRGSFQGMSPTALRDDFRLFSLLKAMEQLWCRIGITLIQSSPQLVPVDVGHNLCHLKSSRRCPTTSTLRVNTTMFMAFSTNSSTIIITLFSCISHSIKVSVWFVSCHRDHQVLVAFSALSRTQNSCGNIFRLIYERPRTLTLRARLNRTPSKDLQMNFLPRAPKTLRPSSTLRKLIDLFHRDPLELLKDDLSNSVTSGELHLLFSPVVEDHFDLTSVVAVHDPAADLDPSTSQRTPRSNPAIGPLGNLQSYASRHQTALARLKDEVSARRHVIACSFITPPTWLHCFLIQQFHLQLRLSLFTGNNSSDHCHADLANELVDDHRSQAKQKTNQLSTELRFCTLYFWAVQVHLLAGRGLHVIHRSTSHQQNQQSLQQTVLDVLVQAQHLRNLHLGTTHKNFVRARSQANSLLEPLQGWCRQDLSEWVCPKFGSNSML